MGSHTKLLLYFFQTKYPLNTPRKAFNICIECLHSPSAAFPSPLLWLPAPVWTFIHYVVVSEPSLFPLLQWCPRQKQPHQVPGIGAKSRNKCGSEIGAALSFYPYLFVRFIFQYELKRIFFAVPSLARQILTSSKFSRTTIALTTHCDSGKYLFFFVYGMLK